MAPNERKHNASKKVRLEVPFFQPVPGKKQYEEVVEQIKNAIFNKSFLPGDKLPPERKLVEQFEVSRASLREGLRVLEQSGLIETKVGRNGGIFVAEPRFQPVGDAVHAMLKLEQGDMAREMVQVYQARALLEPAIVELATQLATESDLEPLESNLAKTKQIVRARNKSYREAPDFHFLIANILQNPIVSMFLNVLMKLQTFYPYRLEIICAVEKDHEEILKAMREKDCLKAKVLMLDHLKQLEARLIEVQVGGTGTGGGRGHKRLLEDMGVLTDDRLTDLTGVKQ